MTHIVGYNSATKMGNNNATPWLNLKNMLSQRSWIQTTECVKVKTKGSLGMKATFSVTF